jgi:hypothetical protein
VQQDSLDLCHQGQRHQALHLYGHTSYVAQLADHLLLQLLLLGKVVRLAAVPSSSSSRHLQSHWGALKPAAAATAAAAAAT